MLILFPSVRVVGPCPPPHILTPAYSPTFRSNPSYPYNVALPSSPALPLQPRLLEHQLQTQRRSYDNEVEALRGELQSVKEENNRQQQLLAQNLQLPPEARIEASLQHEITRLTNENLVRRHTLGEADRDTSLLPDKYTQQNHTHTPRDNTVTELRWPGIYSCTAVKTVQ